MERKKSEKKRNTKQISERRKYAGTAEKRERYVTKIHNKSFGLACRSRLLV